MIVFFVNYSTVAFPLHLPIYLGGMAVLFEGYGHFIWGVWLCYLGVWPFHLGGMVVLFEGTYFNTLSSTNKKQFWKATKCLSKQKSTIPTLMLNDVSASTNSAKAKMLNDFFSSCFNPAVPPLLESLNECPSNHCPDDFLCCEEAVAALIRSLDVSKASGPDGISSRMLKGTLESIVPSLTKLII